MKLKLAKTTLSNKPKVVELSKLEEEIGLQSILYFDQENSHKEIKEMAEYFRSKGYSVYLRDVKYGLDQGESLYEAHIIA